VREADVYWMLNVLATISNGNHPYFAKDYQPPVRVR